MVDGLITNEMKHENLGGTSNTIPPSPIIDPCDRLLVAETKQSIHDLQVELKTVSGFVSSYLIKKYKIKDQQEFDSIFGSLFLKQQ